MNDSSISLVWHNWACGPVTQFEENLSIITAGVVFIGEDF